MIKEIIAIVIMVILTVALINVGIVIGGIVTGADEIYCDWILCSIKYTNISEITEISRHCSINNVEVPCEELEGELHGSDIVQRNGNTTISFV